MVVIMGKKKELRKNFLKIRNEIKRDSAETVMSKLKENKHFKCAKTVFCYVSAGSEPDTWLILEEILKSGKFLAVPKCLDKIGKMVAIKIESLSDLKEGSFGIKEPVCGKRCEKSEIDLCIVPGLAFDKEGFRLGYGGGYYDRFLQGKDIYSIGICFTELVLERLPREENDIAVNEVIYI